VKPPRLAAVIVLLLGGWWLFGWYTSPQRRIGKQLQRIQGLIAKAPGEDNLKALAKARAAADLFAESFEFVAEPFDFQTRDRQSLIRGFLTYRSRAQTILVEIPRKELSVDEAQGRATSLVTVQLITQARDLGGREAYRFQINWRKQDGQWRVDYVRLLEVLEEPPRAWIP
jgi:hypothetical protein